LFCGQKPYPTWPRALPTRVDSSSDPLRTERVAGKLVVVAPAARGSFVLPIVGVGFSLAALTLLGFLAAPLMHPAPAQKIATDLPALVAAPPPLAAVASNTASQMVEPERLSNLEPPPIQIGDPQQESLETEQATGSATLVAPSPLPRDTAPPVVLAPLPPSRPIEVAPPFKQGAAYDQWTAVYDISAHTVYLPDGTRLEAHSGLGDRIDDPRFVDERDRGATPPDVYQLTLRESLFHGVQALRLTPIGGGFTFNRVGLLAHSYMLGPNGDSNGCVSFKNYDAFLRAFQNGEVKRLAVVAQWAGHSGQLGVFASLH
jgi:type VI secretion system (T6SS) effector TldE1-like protein